MAWRQPGDKPLSEPRMESLLTHICVTRPQWVKPQSFFLMQGSEMGLFNKHDKKYEMNISRATSATKYTRVHWQTGRQMDEIIHTLRLRQNGHHYALWNTFFWKQIFEFQLNFDRQMPMKPYGIVRPQWVNRVCLLYLGCSYQLPWLLMPWWLTKCQDASFMSQSTGASNVKKILRTLTDQLPASNSLLDINNSVLCWNLIPKTLDFILPCIYLKSVVPVPD